MTDHDDKTSDEGAKQEEETPTELLQKMSKISLSMAFDLIDKLRYYEKETLKLSEDEIEERLPHVKLVLDKVRAAYLEVAEAEF